MELKTDYDPEHDILFFRDKTNDKNKKKHKEYVCSEQHGNIIIDFGHRGRIIGFEILDVSKVKEWVNKCN